MTKTPPVRLPPLSELDDDQRAVLTHGLVVGGRPAHLFATLVRRPELCHRINALGGAILERGVLLPRERELAILRVAHRTSCAYEHGHHVVMGRAAGLDDATMATVADPAGLDPRDAGLVRTVDAILDQPRVDEATWRELVTRYDEAQVIELLVLVGFYRMLAGVLLTAGTPLDEGLPGWFPDAEPG